MFAMFMLAVLMFFRAEIVYTYQFLKLGGSMYLHANPRLLINLYIFSEIVGRLF